MTGITGVLIFLPVYLFLIKYLKEDILFIRQNFYNNNSFVSFMLVLFIIYFIFHFMQYPNWFIFVSNPYQYELMVYLSMYLASRQIFYSSELTN